MGRGRGGGCDLIARAECQPNARRPSRARRATDREMTSRLLLGRVQTFNRPSDRLVGIRCLSEGPLRGRPSPARKAVAGVREQPDKLESRRPARSRPTITPPIHEEQQRQQQQIMGLFSSSSTNKSGGKDLSHGRFLGPLHPDERKLEQDASVTTTRRRVFVDSNGRGTGEGAEVSMCAFSLSLTTLVPCETRIHPDWTVC